MKTLFQIEDLMLNICLNRYYWRDAIVELQRNREAATTIYDPELEYSPLLQGYFDLMSMSHASDSGRTINPRRSPLQSRTAFQNFCLKRMTSLLLPARFKIKMVGLNIHWMSSFGKRHKMENSVPFLYG